MPRRLRLYSANVLISKKEEGSLPHDRRAGLDRQRLPQLQLSHRLPGERLGAADQVQDVRDPDLRVLLTRSAGLEDLLGFGIDPVAHNAVQGIARYQVDLAAEQCAEPVLQTEKPNQADASVRIEFDQ